MRKSYFNIVVEKLSKSVDKVVDIDFVKKTLQSCMDEAYSDTKAYKLLHQLKNKWYAVSIRKDLLYVTLPDRPVDLASVIQRHYRFILRKHCQTYANKWRTITGLKALELHMMNYDAPDFVDVLDDKKQAQEVIVADKKVRYKTMSVEWKSFLKKIAPYTTKLYVGGYSFSVTNVILSILETLYSLDGTDDTYRYELIKKAMKKYLKSIDRECVVFVLRQGKYHTSINRLHKIARGLDEKLAETIKELIKKHSYDIVV